MRHSACRPEPPHLGVGAARPAPLFLGLTLVVLLSIPWVFAVARRLASNPETPTE